MKVIVGLGNPGKKYAETRHNLGWMALERLAEDLGCSFREMRAFESYVAEVKVADAKVLLVLPQTYMNESGRALIHLLNFYKFKVSDVIVVVDDMAMPFGKFRFRKEGSAGGHNGLKSIEAHFGTRHYSRLRIGIGKVGEAIEHVLGRFTGKENALLPKVTQRAADFLKRLLTEKFENVVGDINASEGERIDE